MTFEEQTSGVFLQPLEEDMPRNKGKLKKILNAISKELKKKKQRRIEALYVSYNPYYVKPREDSKKKVSTPALNLYLEFDECLKKKEEELKSNDKAKVKVLKNPFDMINEDGKLIIK